MVFGVVQYRHAQTGTRRHGARPYRLGNRGTFRAGAIRRHGISASVGSAAQHHRGPCRRHYLRRPRFAGVQDIGDTSR